MLQSCGNDWPTKEQVKDLKGEWKLISIKATDKITFKDTTWAIDGCFIRFGYTGRSGATPLTYAIAPEQIINGYYSVPNENRLLLMPKDPASEYDVKTVGMPTGHQNLFKISGNQLIITGDCVIREREERLISGKRMNLKAVFER